MPTQLIFFDIDDTLCRNGQLTDDNHHTLWRLHQQTDVKIAIATGRGSVMMPPDIRTLIAEGLIDAIVHANGQYNVAYEKTADNRLSTHRISHHPLARANAEALAQRCLSLGLPYQQLSENHIAWSQPMPHFDLIAKDFADVCIIAPDYYNDHTIYQFSVFLSEEEESAHQEYIQAFRQLGFHLTRWQTGGADLLPDGTSKARGIDDICQYFNIPLANTMAFGDGLNDIEMLQHVGIGVAMGDGWPAVKAVADYVTDNLEARGIAKALAHFDVLPD